MESSQYNTRSQLINHTLLFLAAHYITFIVEEVPSIRYLNNTKLLRQGKPARLHVSTRNVVCDSLIYIHLYECSKLQTQTEAHRREVNN